MEVWGNAAVSHIAHWKRVSFSITELSLLIKKDIASKHNQKHQKPQQRISLTSIYYGLQLGFQAESAHSNCFMSRLYILGGMTSLDYVFWMFFFFKTKLDEVV